MSSGSIEWVTVLSPLPTGPLTVGVTELGVATVQFTPESVPDGAPRCAEPHRVAQVRDRFAAYFAGAARELALPVDWRLTNGPHRVVLETLYRTVPCGETVTYGRLAQRSGVFEGVAQSPGLAARTVGQMMGANPLAVLVPCHRVVAADGLGGFGNGRVALDVKRWLLTLEGWLAPTLDWDGPS
ncbi:methylated-DNA--[protein]-cysteine S-methyltransferase [Kitasatospora kifunensis]|uniref:Methylated-DNA--protein-cysteine methyltransferase n=1 Tax=Kitasatospora kifunensis TaxID=58351 RepID=A0A7W7R418_KITKI|nr:methylated-DNA--[protein]-cysteine S-methyltransferase [Kitasatospora kifunensis]MBB4925022.1 methylated-DNA-[protein]-cysteine S-methyltransferase [Kitasatospora kifunensis]